MITHTNFATQQIDWGQSPQTILLQKLPESSEVRPWLTFDGKGVTLQDGGGQRYLEQSQITVQPNGDGVLQVIGASFKEKVYDPHLTVLQGSNKPSFDPTTPYGYGIRWSFWPHYDGTTNQIRVGDKFYVYKLEFIR